MADLIYKNDSPGDRLVSAYAVMSNRCQGHWHSASSLCASLVIATGMETRPGFCAGYGRVRVRVPIIVPGATRTHIYPDPYPSTRVEYWLTKKKTILLVLVVHKYYVVILVLNRAIP